MAIKKEDLIAQAVASNVYESERLEKELRYQSCPGLDQQITSTLTKEVRPTALRSSNDHALSGSLLSEMGRRLFRLRQVTRWISGARELHRSVCDEVSGFFFRFSRYDKLVYRSVLYRIARVQS